MAKSSTISSKKTPPTKGIDDRPNKKSVLPTGRQSVPDQPLTTLQQFITVTPDFLRETVPIIRALMMRNPDVGQAIHNIVTLGNTGHKIFFDKKQSPSDVDAMRNHLENKRKDWASGTAGIDGLINKLISQVLVGGALSAEWVINESMTGVECAILVKPEEIEFKLSPNGSKYIPFQRIKNSAALKKDTSSTFGLNPLNVNTYKYFGLNGDTELPYGFPPYMSVLPRIESQNKMDKNINFIIDQMGLMGFIEALIQKPDQTEGEGDAQYETRLTQLLITAKNRMLEGFKEGVVVGFKDDHEFDFKSASKSYADAVTLYQNNELMTASALKQDASMWGRSYASSETQITVVFIKMLSELKNIQKLVASFIEFGYSLELMLVGFTFDSLNVKFNHSTIQDNLKYQQAEEIKIRNVKDKMIMGIISQDTAADELGYEVPSSPKPMVSWDVLAGGTDPVASTGLATDKTKKKKDLNKKKTASDTKKRQESKILPK